MAGNVGVSVGIKEVKNDELPPLKTATLCPLPITGKVLSHYIDHNLGGRQVVPPALAPYVVRGKVAGQKDVIYVTVSLGDGLNDLEEEDGMLVDSHRYY